MKTEKRNDKKSSGSFFYLISKDFQDFFGTNFTWIDDDISWSIFIFNYSPFRFFTRMLHGPTGYLCKLLSTGYSNL